MTIGGVTYTNVTCPTCGAVLRVGYQALAPEYLIAQAQCPYCGTVVATNVVSLSVVSGPVTPAETAINIGELMNLMITMMIVVMMMKMMMKSMGQIA